MKENYKIGFARPALIRETVIIAQCYRDEKDWDRVKRAVSSENLLQTRTVRSGEIMYSEISKRLSLLNEQQIDLIADDYPPDVRQLVWVMLCKQYHFIGDFTLEVIVQAHLSGRYEISHDDYGYFFNSKAEWHPELEKVADKTRSNARQALFQMLRQCGLISDTNQLLQQMISAAVQNCSSEADLAFIPGAIHL